MRSNTISGFTQNFNAKTDEVCLMYMTDTELLTHGTAQSRVTPLENELLHRLEGVIYKEECESGHYP
jgi:hypothetical protein